jgi:ABC-type phosphate transport system substrate-binding protein
MLMTAALGLAAVSAQAQVVVIISAKNPLSKLTLDQVSQLFQGQAKTFYTGGQAEPLDLAEGNTSRNDFYQKVTAKNAAQIKALRAKLSFSGAAQPPQVLLDNVAMVKRVAEHPKFIGYVDKSAVDASVKVVLVP